VREPAWSLVCVECGARYPGLDVRVRCDCGDVLDVVHDLERLRGEPVLARFDGRLSSRAPADRSGVWRFRELVLPLESRELATLPEGNTNLYASERLASEVGVGPLAFKHEGENPTGSFKDRGMTVGVTLARKLGYRRVACASTGNTSASMAAYAARFGLEAFVFIPEGEIAFGKLAQALAYGATTIQIEGNFDSAMRLVQEVCAREEVYLLNSVNPFRIEGQKAILLELLQDRGWSVPDWIVLPGGNLGNSSAVGKALAELHDLGLIGRLPRLAVVQAAGADPLYRAFATGEPLRPVEAPRTVATAIQIGSPVSWKKCLRAVRATNGVVEEVTDAEILDAKARLDADGIGAEPASCASLAGLAKLVARGVVERGADVCAILTGHVLKDPEVVVRYHKGELEGEPPARANPPVRAAADVDSIVAAMG